MSPIKNPFKSAKARPFDINGDGKIDLADIRAIFTGERHTPKKSNNIIQRRARELWAEFEPDFVLLSLAIQKRQERSRGWLMTKFLGSQDKNVVSILEKLANSLSDSELMASRARYIEAAEEVKNLEKQIADIRASVTLQTEDRAEQMRRSIAKLEAKLDSSEKTREHLVETFRSSLKSYEVELTKSQVEVLLSRVDAGDVTQMTTLFAVLTCMSDQFAEACRVSGESADIARKYYAIYLGLLEIQIHVQTKYIERVEEIYLTGISNIRSQADNLIAETKSLRKGAPKSLRGAYDNNITSQKFTVEVTDVYEKMLKADLHKVTKARAMIRDIHKIAENTLTTVSLSTELVNLMRSAEALFNEVMTLQTPDLIQFGNLELQREFEAVTLRIQSS